MIRLKKKIQLSKLLMFVLALFTLELTFGQQLEKSKIKDTATNYYRYYEFGGAPNYDLNNVAINGLTAYKLSQDAFTYGIRPCLPKKVGKVAAGIWSFSTTFLAMIWSHEFGHSMRARQIRGQFNIHNFAVPFPYATMDLPADASFMDRAISVTGGFEVNYMTSKIIQDDFYAYNGLHNDQLALGFAHRMMYPIYVSFVAPQDPKKKETWIETAGDPVHYTMPVWQEFSDNEVFNADSTVNNSLVQFYGQSALFSTFWNLLDPMFYKEAAALAGDVVHGKKPWYIVNRENIKWTYGTMFNTSPLGYELFLNNYVKVKEYLWVLRLKFGRPFDNNSVVVESPNLIKNKWLILGGYVEYWNQDRYGQGMMISSKANFMLKEKVGLVTQIGYKTKGYSLGRNIDQGFFGWFGVNYNFN